MEGYSVTEAASVLGVPTERVWELLARGVLSGVPDGETGMRVFLQPRPAPAVVEEPRRSNGGGTASEPEAEASPFRELLSEFRNLTERYGQALLALGESRGEVASLRSRVDLLEARFDLRLPMSAASVAQPSAAAGWNARQTAPPPMAEPIAAEDASGVHEAEPSTPRRRRRGQHRATDDFAEALARAEDPSPAELPGGEEAAAAFAALRDDAAHRTTEHADAALPRELPAAEPIAIIEPDDIAQVVPEPVEETEVAAEDVLEPTAEPEVAVEDAPEPIGTAEVEVAVDDSLEPIEEAPAVEAEPVDAEPQLIVEDLATATIEVEAIVASVPEPIEEAEEPPTVEPEIAFDGLPLEAETEAEPWSEPEPAAAPEPVMESSSAEAEPEPAVPALPEPIAEAPAERMGEPEGEPEPEPEPELAAEVDSIETEPEAPVEATSETMVDEPEPLNALQADEETEEPAEVEPAQEWEDAAHAEPLIEADDESEDSIEAQPEGLADAEPSWDRDRYTARIEEPDWIPEERSPQPAATTPPETEARLADTRRPEPYSAAADAEPASPEPPWVGEPSRSTPTGEETMLWFGREPNRAAAAWPTEDDSAAEMEVASTGGHATRPRSVPDEPIAFRPAPAIPPADPPDVRAEYRASLRPQPPSPASRAYRRLRRIFPS